MESTSSDIRSELARLQEREALLTHLLQLERERRVQAEQLVEVELQACLKLNKQLEREKRVAAYNERAEVVDRPDNPAQPLKSDGTVPTGTGEVNGIEVQNDDKENVSLPLSPQNHFDSNSVNDHSASDTSLLAPLPSDNSFDFSLSVFSQLNSDLQQILGIGQSSDTNAQPSSSVSDALETVKANDPQKLQDCITSLQLDKDEGNSLLELASERGYTGCVRVLLNSGCGFSSSSRTDEKTPMHLAAENGHLSSLDLLLNSGGSGGDPNVLDSEDQTPLFLALKQSKTDCVNRLLHSGSLLQPTTKSGFNLLHAAVFGNVPSSLRLLITHLRILLESSKVTQMINHADRDGRTPLHIASSREQTECVQVLCACEELDITRRDRWNRTPFDVATTECRELLLNRESKQVIVRVRIPDSSVHACYHDDDGPSSKVGMAIGRITVLRQHKLSDVEMLVQQILEQYCKLLRGYPHSNRSTSSHLPADSVEELQPEKFLVEKILREYEISKHLVQPSHMSEQVQDESIEVYRRECEQMLRDNFVKTESLDLSESSISSYCVGSYEWKAGRLDKGLRTKSLFSVLGEMGGRQRDNDGRASEMPEIFVTLKGADEGCLDQMAFELMIPIAKLKEYIDLIEQHKTLTINGAQGSGKTHLSTSLADYLKHRHGVEDTQVVHVSLHPSFQRDDLFRIFHLNGLLIPLEEDGVTTNRQHVTPSLRVRTHVVILDDLSHISMPIVLAELLTFLSYRTPSHPMWVSDVYDREGALLYPCGLYYLKEGSYFIATKTTASGEPLEAVSFDQFAHISLGLCTKPISGVLRRQLMALLIDRRQGDAPNLSDPCYRMIQWLMEVWLLFNRFMLRMDLPELTTGLRHFLHLPLKSNEVNSFIKWVCSIWNHHLAPSIENHLTTYPDLVSSSGSQTHHQIIVSKMLVACSRLVFGLTCPLEHETKSKMMDQLMARLEGAVSSDGSPRVQPGRRTVNEPVVDGQSFSTVAPPTDSTPPPVAKISVTSRRNRSQSEKPRKVTSAKPPPAPKAGNMVSYEDMIKNSPRSQARKNKNPSKKENAAKYDTPQTDKPPSSPIPGVVTLRHGAGKSKTLRKLRSKTRSLFSKDGASTLPKLFRRGSRTSLVSLSEEDPVIKHPAKQFPVRKSHPQPNHKPDQLNDIFDMITASNRFDDQRSPPPRQVSISPLPSSVSNTSPPKQETPKGVGDLNDLLYLLDTMGSSRIDDQRSPPPDEIIDGPVPKYVIPTTSPKEERRYRRKGHVLALKSATINAPTSSMPNLTTTEQPNVQHVREHSDGSVFRYKMEVQQAYNGRGTRYARNSVSGAFETSQYQNSVEQNGHYQATDFHPDHTIRDGAHSYHMYDYSIPSTDPLRHRSVGGYRSGNSAKSSPGVSYRPPTSPLAMTSYTIPTSRSTPSPIDTTSCSVVMGMKYGSADSSSVGGFSVTHQHQYSHTDNSSIDLERMDHVSPPSQQQTHLQHRHDEYDSFFTSGSTSGGKRWSGDRIRARSASNLLDDVEEMNDVGDFDLFRASSEGDLLQSSTTRDHDCVDYEGDKDRQMESVSQQPDYVNFNVNRHSDSFNTTTSKCNQHHGDYDSAYKSGFEESYHSYTSPNTHYENSESTSYMNGYTDDTFYTRERSNSVSMPATRYSVNHELKRKISESKLSSPTKSNGNRKMSDTGSVLSASLAFSASLGFLSPDSSLVKHSMSRDRLNDHNVDHAEM